MDQKADIKTLYYEELEALIKKCGLPAFRAGQIFRWFHNNLARDFDDLKNVGKETIGILKENTALYPLTIVRVLESKLDGTKKFAFALHDGNIIESVFMRYKHGNSVCISSQAGCRMGCRFCASTVNGLARNLTASEMLEQVYEISRITGERISNVVIMGSGEPLDNYDNTVRFIRLISDSEGYNMSRRNITLSTCGLVPQIKKLADEDLPVTLAISLHAPNDELRKKTMPIAQKYSVADIRDACVYYFEKTGRRVTFEYSVIKDLNDGRETIDELARYLLPLHCHLNLISVNPIKERNYARVGDFSLSGIKKILENKGINVTIRRRLGSDIDSSCGQLRLETMSEIKTQGKEGLS